jgi:DNA topoisomerase I
MATAVRLTRTASASEMIARAQRAGRATARTLTKMVGDVEASAAAVGLIHVAADEPGYHRVKRGRGFAIVDERGRVIRDRRVLARIRALVIPPAWTDVWICKSAHGHLQALGRDARGRKQYRYHPKFRAVRDAAKYEHMRAFCRALPKLRKQIDHDLACRCLCKEKVVAAVVSLIERGQVRVGNAEYMRTNGSYGATTLQGRHARVQGQRIVLSYRGKSGKRREVRVRDARLARVVRQCKSLRGARLFRWRDGTRVSAVTSGDVNDYVHRHAGALFTAKDFRTWAATIATAVGLARLPAAESPTGRKRGAAEVVRSVAERLGNTPAVCRKSYVHPLLIDRYVGGQLGPPLKRLARIAGGANELDARLMARVENAVFDMLS